jgi:prolyl oligopeptidase
LGDDWLDDELLWGALPQPTSWPWIDAVSPDGRYLVIGCQNGWSQHDLHLHDTLTSAWIPLVEGEEAINSAAFWDDRVVVNTTFDAPRGRVVSAPLSTPNVEHWETLIPERDVVVSAVSVASDGLYVVASDRGIDVVERYDQSGRLQATLDGLGPVSIAGMSSRVAEPGVVITITGFDRPTGIGLWDGSGEAPTLVSPEFVPTASDAGTDVATPFPGGALTVGYHRYRSDDGTEVGLFLMHRSDVVPSPATPLVLYGYGGFGITMAPAWTPRWAAWCAAGGAVAIAALRGGGEEGEGWHHAGRRDNKQNVFDDFHAAARHVVEQGWTSPEHLGIAGGSNGGLLVGAALTQHPEMYRAVWCAVPLLDMVRFPRFLIAKLWTDEYGDPEVADEFAWLVGYSPYHRVVDGEHYPAVLFTTAESDTRVDPLHARKMAALLQNTSRSADLRPVFLYQEARAGHGVGKPLGKQADEAADALTFLAWQLGLDAP